jgi:sphinganine-1-phosphate aldolase
VKGLQDAEIGGVEAPDLYDGAPITPASSTMLEDGRCWSDIRDDLVARKNGDYDWRAGRTPIYVYHDNDELLSVSREAYGLYFTENALGRRAFPSLVRMEEDIIRMSLSLFRAPQAAGGSFTSGGTESIFLALKTARDRFRATRGRELRPVVVVPVTAHPAFDKAAHYLDIDVVRIDVGSDLRVDVTRLSSAIDDRTIMIVGSAPCYPYGVYDQISLLGEIAISKDVWLHVDACLGGFLAPFARDEGYAIPDFDFSIPGVTSLSADLHKYGFAAKGASVLLFCSATLQAFQGFHFENWPRGTYSTETFLGSRPGGAIASAWAVSQYLGRMGYRRLARKTMEAKQRLVQGIEMIKGLEVISPSELSIVLYKSVDGDVDIKGVAEVLSEKGWFVGRSREPKAIHLALNAVHAPIIDEYILDLRDAVRRVRILRRVGKEDDMTY